MARPGPSTRYGTTSFVRHGSSRFGDLQRSRILPSATSVAGGHHRALTKSPRSVSMPITTSSDQRREGARALKGRCPSAPSGRRALASRRPASSGTCTSVVGLGPVHANNDHLLAAPSRRTSSLSPEVAAARSWLSARGTTSHEPSRQPHRPARARARCSPPGGWSRVRSADLRSRYVPGDGCIDGASGQVPGFGLTRSGRA